MSEEAVPYNPESPASRQAYLDFLGVFFLIVGALSFVVSLGVVIVLITTDNPILTPAGDAPPFWEGGPLTFEAFVVAYLSFQIWSGLLFGPLAIWAGKSARAGRRLELVKGTAIISLVYFPMGTTFGILALIGLSNPELIRGFDTGPTIDPADEPVRPGGEGL
ncbi:MAG: hypothetical protein ACFE0O_00830 [Opitutales bacterium]